VIECMMSMFVGQDLSGTGLCMKIERGLLIKMVKLELVEF